MISSVVVTWVDVTISFCSFLENKVFDRLQVFERRSQINQRFLSGFFPFFQSFSLKMLFFVFIQTKPFKRVLFVFFHLVENSVDPFAVFHVVNSLSKVGVLIIYDVETSLASRDFVDTGTLLQQIFNKLFGIVSCCNDQRLICYFKKYF